MSERLLNMLGLMRKASSIEIGETNTGMNSLNAQLVKYRPGDTIEVTYYRDRAKHVADVMLMMGSNI